MKWYGLARGGMCGRIALKVLFSVGVSGGLQPVMDGVDAGNGDWRKFGVELFHGCDLNAFQKKAVSLHGLYGLGSLKSSSI